MKFRPSAVLALAPVLGVALLAAAAVTAPASAGEPVQVFFSAGCSDCWVYVNDVLMPTLKKAGIDAPSQIHDYTTPEERTQLLEMSDGWGVPRSIADSLYAFVLFGDKRIVILGHVPADLVRQMLAYPKLPPRLIIWQPEMHGTPSEYRLWAWSGEVQTFDISTPFSEALPVALSSGGPLPVGLANLGALLPAVIVTGLLDSVNPCAFAVILLLLAFLFTLRQTRGRVLKLGGVYILMIFLVYFAIGLGLLQALRISNDPHFVARAGSWLLIGLGAINLTEYFFPQFPIKLHMPKLAGAKANELIGKATLPATIGAGFLVGLCTFPCSGGIYVSIITLLNASTTLAWGVAYLALYNILFVLPLIVILVIVGNRAAAKGWARWERQHAGSIRLWYGLAMVALGAAMLVFVIG